MIRPTYKTFNAINSLATIRFNSTLDVFDLVSELGQILFDLGDDDVHVVYTKYPAL